MWCSCCCFWWLKTLCYLLFLYEWGVLLIVLNVPCKLGWTVENHIVFRLVKRFWHRNVLWFQPCCNSVSLAFPRSLVLLCSVKFGILIQYQSHNISKISLNVMHLNSMLDQETKEAAVSLKKQLLVTVG